MRIPLSDSDTVYVSESQYVTKRNGVKCRAGYLSVNDIYEGKSGYITMTYAEFKEKYPIPSDRYNWCRYVERSYS